MNDTKTEQAQDIVEEFSDELLDEALDRGDGRDSPYCTCGSSVCGTKCI